MPTDHHDDSLLVQHANPTEDVEPVHALHLHVEEYHVRAEDPEVFERVRSVGHRLDLMILVLEELSQGLANRALVVDDQQLSQWRTGDRGRWSRGLRERRPE